MTIWWMLMGLLCASIIVMGLLFKRGKLSGQLRLIGGSVIGFILLLTPLFGQPRIENSTLWRLTGTILAIMGSLLFVSALREFHKCKVRPYDLIPTRLVVTGPYGVVRHPQIIGGILILLGWSLVWAATYCLFLILLLAIIALFAALGEEKYILEKVFGKQYREYMKEVGMFLPKVGKHLIKNPGF